MISILDILVKIIKFIITKFNSLVKKIIHSIFKQLLASCKLLKRELMLMINLFCLVILVFNFFDMTTDYLKFKYYYKLKFDDENRKCVLPPITLCTDEGVVFDKGKFLIHLSLSVQYENYRNILYFNHNFNSSVWKSIINENCNMFENFNIYKYEKYIWYENQEPAVIKWTINYCLNKYFFEYKRKILLESNIEEMNSLIIMHTELFQYTLKIDENLENIKPIINKPIISTILPKFNEDNDFGICYKFFSNNYKYFFRSHDYLNIKINEEYIKRFIVEKSFKYEHLRIHSENRFNWFILSDGTQRKHLTIKLTKVPFDLKLNAKQTIIQRTSIFSDAFCQNNSMY